MRRVYFTWMLRQALSASSVKVMIILASLWQIKQLVYVRAVFENMPSITDIAANLQFFSSAFTHTHVTVQLYIIASGILALWLAKDIRQHQLGYWF
mgnify:CR=1 FL=1